MNVLTKSNSPSSWGRTPVTLRCHAAKSSVFSAKSHDRGDIVGKASGIGIKTESPSSGIAEDVDFRNDIESREDISSKNQRDHADVSLFDPKCRPIAIEQDENAASTAIKQEADEASTDRKPTLCSGLNELQDSITCIPTAFEEFYTIPDQNKTKAANLAEDSHIPGQFLTFAGGTMHSPSPLESSAASLKPTRASLGRLALQHPVMASSFLTSTTQTTTKTVIEFCVGLDIPFPIRTNDNDVLVSSSPGSPKERRNEDSSRRFQRWTFLEDQALRHGMELGGGPPYDWNRIAKEQLANKRTAAQCKSRWKNGLCPEVNRLPFTKEEDECILHYRQLGMGWPEIAAHIPGRVGEQIRDRFVNSIDPDRKLSPWTQEEDDLLTEYQAKHGNKWTYISKLLPGRSENAIKNRWHNRKTKQRRAMRRMTTRLNAANVTHSNLLIGLDAIPKPDNDVGTSFATSKPAGSSDEPDGFACHIKTVVKGHSYTSKNEDDADS